MKKCTRFSLIGSSLLFCLLALPSCGGLVAVDKPDPPASLSATALSSSGISLRWTDLSGGKDSFSVERSLSAGSGFAGVKETAVGATAHSDAGLNAGTTYYYRLHAHRGSAISDYTAPVSATTLASGGGTTGAPAKPTNLVATAQSTTSIRLTWADAATNETGYDVVRAFSLSDTNPVIVTSTSHLPAGTTSYTDTGLSPATDYLYIVSAFNAQGSTLSDAAYGTTLSASSLLAPASSLATGGVFNDTIYLSWAAVTGASSYKVYKSWAANGDYVLLGTMPAANGSYAWVNGVLSGSSFFKISALDSASKETLRSPAAEGWTGTDIFDEDFEAGAVGGYWTQRQTLAVNASIVTGGAGSTGHALMLGQSAIASGDRPGLVANLNKDALPTYVAFSVKVASSTGTYLAYLNAYESTRSSTLKTLYFMVDSGNLFVRDFNFVDQGKTPCTPNVWYFVELKNINFTTHTYDFWVDGASKATGVTMFYNGPSVHYLDFYVGNPAVNAYFDGIIVR